MPSFHHVSFRHCVLHVVSITAHFTMNLCTLGRVRLRAAAPAVFSIMKLMCHCSKSQEECEGWMGSQRVHKAFLALQLTEKLAGAFWAINCSELCLLSVICVNSIPGDAGVATEEDKLCPCHSSCILPESVSNSKWVIVGKKKKKH